ncbi:hypothetical protein L2737_22155, partial [Shewanella electrodiphila]|nr:hypothetical protein [Shewanella electrodiphila]
EDVVVNADGTYSVDDVDLSALVDGDITIVATATDANGNPLTANDTEALDATAGAITVDLVIDENNLGDISGTSQDIPAGSTVTLTLTDSAGNTIVIEDVVVNADGTYSVDDVDLSALVDGDITIVATATDANGNPISANDTEALDATAGAITVDLVIDENNLGDISGTSQDIPAGGTVTLTLTDSAGNTIVIEDVVVNADGTYSVDDVDLSTLVDGDITIVATATDANGNPLTANDTEALDATAGSIDVALVINDGAETADISGTTTDVAPNSTVTLTLTDSAGTVQVITGVTVDANGDYSIAGVDISSLVDGDITVDASAVDQNGQTVTDADTDNMDATAGSIDVALVINDGAETADISGTTTDVAPNSTVTLTLTDSAGTVQIITGVTVDANGDYSIDGVDISGLVDGDITVDASAVDQNGQTVTDADTDNMDATAGSIDVALVINDGAETADISGTTTDVAPNSTVTLTLTDSAGTVQVITGVTVDANGDYSIDGVDISGLVDGDITVDASAVDQNGQTVTDADTDNMDATAGSIDVALVINDGAETADISGTTTDVAPNSTVTLTLTDSAGTVQVITGVTVDVNGDYSIDGVDISGLVDGDITVDASAVDQNGQTVTDADTDNMDATAGSIDVALTIDDGAETADI